MPAFAASLLLPFEPWLAAFFLPLSAASMHPLLLRDGQALPCIALVATSSVVLCTVASKTAPAATRGPQAGGSGGVQLAAQVLPALAQEHSTPHMAASRARGASMRPGAAGEVLAEQPGTPTGEVPSEQPGAPTGAGRACRAAAKQPEVEEASLAEQPAAGKDTLFPALRRRRLVSPPLPAPAAPENGTDSRAAQGLESSGGQCGVVPWLWPLACVVSMAGVAVLTLARSVVPPPEKLPFLHDALLTTWAFLGFVGVWLYGNVQQWRTCGRGVLWE